MDLLPIRQSAYPTTEDPRLEIQKRSESAKTHDSHCSKKDTLLRMSGNKQSPTSQIRMNQRLQPCSVLNAPLGPYATVEPPFPPASPPSKPKGLLKRLRHFSWVSYVLKNHDHLSIRPKRCGWGNMCIVLNSVGGIADSRLLRPRACVNAVPSFLGD